MYRWLPGSTQHPSRRSINYPSVQRGVFFCVASRTRTFARNLLRDGRDQITHLEKVYPYADADSRPCPKRNARCFAQRRFQMQKSLQLSTRSLCQQVTPCRSNPIRHNLNFQMFCYPPATTCREGTCNDPYKIPTMKPGTVCPKSWSFEPDRERRTGAASRTG